MTPMDDFNGTYHIVLIGIDGYRSAPLAGCVNDIDLIEKLLLDPPGIGVPAERMKVTRLAARRSGLTDTSRFADKTLAPTRENILAAFKSLSGDAVALDDRVLIYYSGHGGQQRWATRDWHESIVPVDEKHIFDDELNGWLNAIAKTEGDRMVDLTVVLDCCHSSGATREAFAGVQDDARMATRSMPTESTLVAPPDLSQIPRYTPRDPSAPRLRPIDPPYLVVAACQADEVAGEKDLGGGRHGNLTRVLAQRLAGSSAERRAALRWGEIWPDLLDELRTLGATAPVTPPQNPWIIGRPERRLFGGAWEPRDLGYAVTLGDGGRYRVRAGSLLGVTVGAELAVYGPDEPPRFSVLGSEADLAKRIGRLRVVEAARASAVAEAIEMSAVMPEGARARLAKAGAAGGLRVRLEPFDAEVAAELDESGVIETLADAAAGGDAGGQGGLDAEVTIAGSAAQGWAIKSEFEPFVAGVPAGQIDALRAGLESYAAYNQALRLARELREPDGAARLSMRLLQVDPSSPVVRDKRMDAAAMAAQEEAPKGSGGDYNLPDGFPFCIEVTNHQPETLNVTILNCTAGGKVEYLDAKPVRELSTDWFWLAGEIGEAFEAWPSMGRLHAADRLIAVGTSRRDVDLSTMGVADNVQDVVDRVVNREFTRDVRPRPAAAPAEIWTATTTTVRIYQRGQQATAMSPG